MLPAPGNTAFLLWQPLPCNPAAETALHPQHTGVCEANTHPTRLGERGRDFEHISDTDTN